ncbi:hypothetical protein GGTG_12593 [Gaeumannomyces tritici R3-111a-1]|uniref:WSC domain-containing protein n=1 Tax=Gaeumannomyces tritici (strain R3-111a-1) TaxID=644352 RepID=J3PGG8_GAET3|nr:hypothetical protein GGTG_12593 [Gaeumannomyces tritici R3-111a-1]EJT69710.1 hypothetical protein GGTG_12593 [Gaeumannomyces tritici R3-111a-1]
MWTKLALRAALAVLTIAPSAPAQQAQAGTGPLQLQVAAAGGKSPWEGTLSPGTAAPGGGGGGWKYVGCTAELSSGRALSGSTINPQNMTIELCMDYCTERNFPYAGLEYSQECYCGLKPHKDSTPTPNAECSSPCKGNAKQLCGRGGRLSLFENTAYVAASNAQRLGAWSYVSCYMEPQRGRALPDRLRSAANMTVEACHDYCDSEGMPFAGLENGRECRCGRALRQGLEDASDPMCAMQCDMTCLGNDKQFCGGSKTINVWHKDAAAAAATTRRDVQRREEMLREHKREAAHNHGGGGGLGARFVRARRAAVDAPGAAAAAGVI